ncbi:MAG: hypothetical protein ACOC6B_04775 [Thermodesulfobacteriota bacterium]
MKIPSKVAYGEDVGISFKKAGMLEDGKLGGGKSRNGEEEKWRMGKQIEETREA